MNKMEIARLLTAIAALDNRKVLEETVEAWYAVLHSYPYGDAAEAVRQHFEDSTEYLMPAHVRAGVKRIKAERNPSSDTSPERFKALERGEIRSAPRPANWDAMSAAWRDPEKFSQEIAAYEKQLAGGNS